MLFRSSLLLSSAVIFTGLLNTYPGFAQSPNLDKSAQPVPLDSTQVQLLSSQILYPMPDRTNPSVLQTAPQTRISGTVRVTNCNPGANGVRVSAGSTTVIAQPDDQGLAYTYEFTKLPSGTYTINPSFAEGNCAEGSWSPATRSVTVPYIGDAGIVQDFEFNAPRRNVPLREVSRTTRLENRQIQSLGNILLRGTQIQLNNFNPIEPPDPTHFWHRANDSRIRLGPALGGGEFVFDLPETRIPYGTGQARYYINNLNTSRMSIALEGSEIKISLFFANRGRELEGHQEGAIFGPPSFNLRDTRLDVFLTPTRDAAGRLSYSAVRVVFDSQIAPADTWSSVLAHLADLIGTQYQAQIKTAVENRVRGFLLDSNTRELITSGLQEQLNTLGIRNLLSVRVEGTALVLEQRV